MEPEEGIEPASTEQADSAAPDDRLDSLEDALNALGEEEPEVEQSGEDETPEIDPEEAEIDLDGDKITLKELKDGYFRQRDYTAKTAEVAQIRKAYEVREASLTERTSELNNAVQNLGAFFQGIVGPEPTLSAYPNPNDFLIAKAKRDQMVAELGQLMAVKNDLGQVQGKQTEAEQRAHRENETASLIKAMPYLADPVKRAIFDQGIQKTGKDFGFSEQEIASTADHRVLRLVHYARLGMRAEQAQKAMKSKPAEAPKTGKAQAATVPTQSRVDNLKAMQRLNQSGSLQDALKVDFE